MKATEGLDASHRRYREVRREHWSAAARRPPSRGGHWYRARLEQIYRSLIPPGLRVLELGSGRGDLLAALRPSLGVGIDFSDAMVRAAAGRYPAFHFVHGDLHEIPIRGEFDVIVLSDVVNDVWDVQRVFEEARRLSHPGTRLVLNFYSRVWELPLAFGASAGLATPRLQQNWLTTDDVTGLLQLAGFEPLRAFREILLPAPVPGIEQLCNRVLVKVWPFSLFALTNIVVARPIGQPVDRPLEVSIVVPARNEEGNVESIFRRTEYLGSRAELIFVEGHSTDRTFERIQEEMQRWPARRCLLMRQPGSGKGDAVRFGFQHARGDVLLILDADLTVAPEDLSRFIDAIESGRGEFINGVRLVYPMEGEAMRPLNFVGNKFFSLAFTWLLGQSIKDTLCGTKVLRREHYDRIAANRAYFGDFDPFGDFDLLFGAARLNLKIVDLPVRYRARTYGTTNIQRWRHGWVLLRMVMFAAKRLKFV